MGYPIYMTHHGVPSRTNPPWEQLEPPLKLVPTWKGWPLVASGRLLVSAEDFSAFDVNSLELLWRRDSPENLCPETITDGQIWYCVERVEDKLTRLLALSVETGEILWTYDAQDFEFGDYDLLLISGLLLSYPRAYSALSRGGKNLLVAFDVRERRLAWIGERDLYSFAANDQFVVGFDVADCANRLVALRLRDGKVAWETTTPATNWGFRFYPVLVNDLCIVATGGGFPGYTVSTGELLWTTPWTTPEGKYVTAGPGVFGDVGYGFNYHELIAFSLKTGEILLRNFLNDELHRRRISTRTVISGGLLVTQRHVYFGDGLGWVMAADRHTGELVWAKKTKTGYAERDTPFIARGRLYIQDFCFEPSRRSRSKSPKENPGGGEA